VELDPPPGDRAAAASPTNDDPAVAPPDRKAVLGSQRFWPDWDSILHDRSFLKDGPFFLELFAGLAGLTEAVYLAGVPVLPPVDIVPSPLVTTPRDLVDYVVWRQILEILALGVVFFLHCGTPCNTFTSARKEDGALLPCALSPSRSGWTP
jgi:hypothetical protein